MRSNDVLEQQYPALWQFFGAYLHQDWREEYESTSDALRDFVSGSPDLAIELPHELQHVLTTTPDDVLDELIGDLGSFFVPSRTGQSPRDWLRRLKDEAQFLVGRAYEEPAPASREDLESAVATGDPAAISRAMVGVLEDGDADWLTDTLLDLTRHESTEVRATAITSLGHVSRIHGHIDWDRVLPRLRELRSDPLLRGRIDDAIDDIEHFADPSR
jgi:hypothetical protein